VDLYKHARDFPSTLRGRAKILTSAQIARAGVSPTSTRWHTGKGRLWRPYHGIYLLTEGPVDLLDRVRAALRGCPPGTVVGFHTAAALQGFGVPEDDDIHVVLPANRLVPRRRGVRAHEFTVAFEPVLTAGVACTPPARTAIDLVRTVDRPSGLAVLDAALYARACTAEELAAEVLRHDAQRGVIRARELVPLADARAECRQESHLRLVLHDGGLGGFEPQVEVWDPQRWSPYARYRLDLADRAHLVAAEYDGESHLRGGLRRDRARHNWLDEHGWTMRYFTDEDLYRRPGRIVPVLRRAIATSRQADTAR
jgi:very-short-patch-repair endonuclease